MSFNNYHDDSVLPSDHPIRFTNPDGSKSMIQRGKVAFVGGRTSHLGSAIMPIQSGRPPTTLTCGAKAMG